MYFPIEIEFKVTIDDKTYAVGCKNSSKYLDTELENIKYSYMKTLKKLGKAVEAPLGV